MLGLWSPSGTAVATNTIKVLGPGASVCFDGEISVTDTTIGSLKPKILEKLISTDPVHFGVLELRNLHLFSAQSESSELENEKTLAQAHVKAGDSLRLFISTALDSERAAVFVPAIPNANEEEKIVYLVWVGKRGLMDTDWTSWPSAQSKGDTNAGGDEDALLLARLPPPTWRLIPQNKTGMYLMDRGSGELILPAIPIETTQLCVWGGHVDSWNKGKETFRPEWIYKWNFAFSGDNLPMAVRQRLDQLARFNTPVPQARPWLRLALRQIPVREELIERCIMHYGTLVHVDPVPMLVDPKERKGYVQKGQEVAGVLYTWGKTAKGIYALGNDFSLLAESLTRLASFCQRAWFLKHDDDGTIDYALLPVLPKSPAKEEAVSVAPNELEAAVLSASGGGGSPEPDDTPRVMERDQLSSRLWDFIKDELRQISVAAKRVKSTQPEFADRAVYVEQVASFLAHVLGISEISLIIPAVHDILDGISDARGPIAEAFTHVSNEKSDEARAVVKLLQERLDVLQRYVGQVGTNIKVEGVSERVERQLSKLEQEQTTKQQQEVVAASGGGAALVENSARSSGMPERSLDEAAETLLSKVSQELPSLSDGTNDAYISLGDYSIQVSAFIKILADKDYLRGVLAIMPFIPPAVVSVNGVITQMQFIFDRNVARLRTDPDLLKRLFDILKDRELYKDTRQLIAKYLFLTPSKASAVTVPRQALLDDESLSANSPIDSGDAQSVQDPPVPSLNDEELDRKLDALGEVSHIALDLCEKLPNQLDHDTKRVNVAFLGARGVFGLVLVTGTASLLAAAATRLYAITTCSASGLGRSIGLNIDLSSELIDAASKDQNALTGARSLFPLAIPFAVTFGISAVAGVIVFEVFSLVINQDHELTKWAGSTPAVLLCALVLSALGFGLGLLAELGDASTEILSTVFVTLFGVYQIWACASGLKANFRGTSVQVGRITSLLKVLRAPPRETVA
jgi:hypothetical protein